MHTTKVTVAKIPIGFDKNIDDTIRVATDIWKEATLAGKWCVTNGINVQSDEVYVLNEELGGELTLVADLDESTAVAYKLMFGSL
jgi:hypothetical protein